MHLARVLDTPSLSLRSPWMVGKCAPAGLVNPCGFRLMSFQPSLRKGAAIVPIKKVVRSEHHKRKGGGEKQRLVWDDLEHLEKRRGFDEKGPSK